MMLSRQMVAPALGVIASCLLLLATGGLDHGVPAGRLGPAFWPRLVLVCLAGTCLVRLAGALRGRSTTTATGPDTTVAVRDAIVAAPGVPGPIRWARLAGAMALILLYVLAAPVTGFPLGTVGFVVGFMWVSGARSAAGIAAGALLGRSACSTSS